MQDNRKQTYIAFLHAAILIAVTLFAYHKIFDAGFISWDDADYTINNRFIYGWTAENMSRWFSGFYIGHYHPLTLASYAIDYALFGKEPFGYHLTNIIFHILNAILLYAFVNKIQGNKWVSLFVAMLFAIHPVQTESVSWIAERKNVLYGFFFLTSMWLYTLYVAEEKKKFLVLVTLSGLAAMLSKEAAIALPVSLLAIDVWLHRPLNNKKVWIEKIPLFVAAFVMGIMAIKAQQHEKLLNIHPEFGWYHTVFFAGYTYVQYIMQLLLPVKLSVLYPYPQELSPIHIIYSIIAVAILVTGYIAYKRKWYMLCGGIIFYSANIVLFLQFVQFGEVLMSDRYLYTACIGVFLPLVHYLFAWLIKQSKEIVAIAAMGVVCIVLLVMVNERNRIWLSEIDFWEAIVQTFPESSVAQSSYGGVYMMMGDYRQATEHIDEALRLDANNYKAWYNKGVLHLRKSEMRDAAIALDKCIAIREYPKALFSRAMLYEKTGQADKALTDIEKVLENEPENARAYYIKGGCMEQMGNYQYAINNYNKAIALGGNDPVFLMRRGTAHMGLRDYQSAIHDFSIVIEQRAELGEAWYMRGMAKQMSGQMPCHDLNKARNLGYKEAEQALVKFCNSY